MGDDVKTRTAECECTIPSRRLSATHAKAGQAAGQTLPDVKSGQASAQRPTGKEGGILQDGM